MQDVAALSTHAARRKNDKVAQRLEKRVSDQRDQKPPVTTTDAGIPAPSDDHSLTIGPNGPILLQDHYLIQKMAQFNRERVPERVVHANGTGAFGYFEVTKSAAFVHSAADLVTSK